MTDNLIQFPIIPRPVPKKDTVFIVTINKPGGQKLITQATNPKHSMDLVMQALQEHPDAVRISVIKETLQ